MRDLPRGTQVVDQEADRFVYRAITFYGPPFLTGSTHDRLCNSSGVRQDPDVDSYNPCPETAAAYHAGLVWAVPFSLATTQGMISVPPATEMFQFADLPQPGLCIQPRVTGHYPSLVSQFGHPRVSACLTAHRGLSQPATSFIGS